MNLTMILFVTIFLKLGIELLLAKIPQFSKCLKSSAVQCGTPNMDAMEGVITMYLKRILLPHSAESTCDALFCICCNCGGVGPFLRCSRVKTTIHLRFAGARNAFRLPNGVKKAVPGAKTAFVHPKIHRKSQTRGCQCDDSDGHMFYSLRQKRRSWDTVAVYQIRSLFTGQLINIQKTFSGISKKMESKLVRAKPTTKHILSLGHLLEWGN